METQNKEISNTFFVSGYFKQIEQLYLIVIPNPIVDLITAYFSMFVVFGIGLNGNGELGLRNTAQQTKFIRLTDFENVIISTKYIYRNYNGIIVKSINNELYCTGCNQNSTLHIPTIKYLSKLTKIKLNAVNNIKLCSQSNSFVNQTFILTENNKLLISGLNVRGTFGNGLQQQSNSVLYELNPYSFINNNEHIIDIRCCELQTSFLTDKGNVYRCGDNRHGQCDRNRNIKTILQPKLLKWNNKIIAINGGCFHNIMIDDQYNVIVFGLNGSGQCGFSTYNKIYQPIIHPFFNDKQIKIITIECGYHFTICIDNQGNGYWFGKLGSYSSNILTKKPKELSIHHPLVTVSCGMNHCVFLSIYNDIFTFGNNANNQCSTVCNKALIDDPYQWNKKKELEVKRCPFIEKAIGLRRETIVIVNPFK